MNRAPNLAELERVIPRPRPALGSVAHPQLDLPAMIERERSIGVVLKRQEWLDTLEPLTKTHREKMAAHHALQKMLHLESPGNELVGPAIDSKKLQKMADHAKLYPEGIAQEALEMLAGQMHERAVDRILIEGPRHYDAELSMREQRIADLELITGTAPDRRIYKQLEEGDLKYAHGGSITGYHWHKSREKGQRERFEKVRTCGNDRMVRYCGSCNVRGPKITLTCDNVRLCLSCRKRRTLKFQKRFEPSRKAAMQEAWRLRLLAPTRVENGRPLHGGQWSERFMTFTLPHSGDVISDVQELPKAWRRMQRLLMAHIGKDVLRDDPERKELLKRIRYCRVLEVTEGALGDGHAHMHLWFLGPYLDQARVAHLWGEALSKRYRNLLMSAAKRARAGESAVGDPDHDDECACGKAHERAVGVQSVDLAMERLRCRLRRNRVGEEAIKHIERRERSWYMTRRSNALGKGAKPLVLIWKPVVDVRTCGADVAGELCKYLIKDGKMVEGQLELMDPEIYSRIYAALEGRRAIACSRGFLVTPMTRGCYCEGCGSTYTRWIESGLEVVRGPPDQATLSV